MKRPIASWLWKRRLLSVPLIVGLPLLAIQDVTKQGWPLPVYIAFTIGLVVWACISSF